MTGFRLAVVGGGNMAQAILRGAFDAGLVKPDEVLIAEPEASRRAVFESLGARTVDRALAFGGRLSAETQILLAVKPQMMSQAAEDLAGGARGRVVISILAGATSGRIAAALGEGVRVVRVMPNLPARIRQGVAAIALGAGTQPNDAELAERLFTGVGEVVSIDESLMDAFTALAGSGPAYVFYLAEAMCDAAVSMGFAPDVALRIVRATVAGSGALLAASEESPTQLREAVTSRKGTTDAAITSLEKDQVARSIVRAIHAARDRGAELAAE